MKTAKLPIMIIWILSLLFIACDKENTEDYYENQEGDVEVLLTFGNFKKQIKSLTISNFMLISITAGESGSHEYEATYKNKEGKYLFVKIGELATTEPIWLNPHNTYYLVEERKAEYGNSGYIYGLTIHLPQLEAEMGVYATTDLGKSEFEKIANQSGFLIIDPETVSWPANIPANHKLAGWLLDVSIGDYYDTPGFSKQMDATMMLNDELAQAYKNAYNTYYDDETNHIVFPNGTYLIVPSDYFNNDIYGIYEKYDRITFHYYLP